MHRIKRTANNIADSGSDRNPFCRLRQNHRQKALARRRARQARNGVSPETFKESEGTNGQTGNEINGPGIEESQVSSRYSERELNESRTVWGQIRTALFNSWINVLLVFVPVGISMHYAGVNGTVVFVMNFIAIIPLAALLSYGTEEIALYCGNILGGLLNASLGNAVELIISILALLNHKIAVVQTSLIGSILSNLLLSLGAAFIAGGYNRVEQHFNTSVAKTSGSILALSVGSLIVPTAFHLASEGGDKGITELSRGTSVILLVVYGSYLFFQLKTHTRLYSEPSEKSPKRNQTESASRSLANASASLSHAVVMGTPRPENEEEGEEEKEQPDLSIWAAAALLVASTALVAVCAECLVGSIGDLVETSGISEVFLGLILLPIVGNAGQSATAVAVAIKDKMDLAIGVVIGSSLQISLLVIPLIVVLGWILGIDEMALYFDGFQVMVLFASVLLANYLIQDGRSNYLEGNLLVALYLIVAIASWFYPADGALAQVAGN